MPVAASIFIHFFCISFLGIGGFIVTLPDIYRWIVAADGLMTPEAFQAAVAIGQASPGPNMIICWAIGWFAMGPAGAAAAPNRPGGRPRVPSPTNPGRRGGVGRNSGAGRRPRAP